MTGQLSSIVAPNKELCLTGLLHGVAVRAPFDDGFWRRSIRCARPASATAATATQTLSAQGRACSSAQCLSFTVAGCSRAPGSQQLALRDPRRLALVRRTLKRQIEKRMRLQVTHQACRWQACPAKGGKWICTGLLGSNLELILRRTYSCRPPPSSTVRRHASHWLTCLTRSSSLQYFVICCFPPCLRMHVHVGPSGRPEVHKANLASIARPSRRRHVLDAPDALGVHAVPGYNQQVMPQMGMPGPPYYSHLPQYGAHSRSHSPAK